jgi:hypothetical protein
MSFEGVRMHCRAVAGCGLLAGALTLAAAVALPAQTPSAQEPSSPGAGKAPVYILLHTTVDDVLNAPVSMERLPRAMEQIERLRSRAASWHPTCLVQFNGVAADSVGVGSHGNRLVSTIQDGVARGLLEVGYDGREEPTFPARPRPNLRGADTAEKRYLARLQAFQWFLTEWKHPYSGEPDPSQTGGLKRVAEVFGRVDFARGATFEPWYGGELVHALESFGVRPALAGFLEPTVHPTRNFDGYRGGAPGVSDQLAPDERCAPEVFWLDTALRISDYAQREQRVINAYEGPDALAALVEKLDRSKLRVIQVRLGHPAVYAKPGFGARNYQTPLEYAYDNMKVPDLPPEALRSPEERQAMYAKEEATLDWLVGSFFPANAGSRFVSVRQLVGRAEAGLSDAVTRAELSEAAAELVAEAGGPAAQLPLFVRAGRRFFSLADLFGLLVASMGDAAAPGEWPGSTRPLRLFGPVEVADPATQVTGVRIPIAALVKESGAVRTSMTAGGWAPIPRNTVPSYVTVGSARLTAAQFLRALAEAFVAAPGTLEIEVKWTPGSNGFAGRFPETRPSADRGGTWTAKPALIRFPD